MNLEDRIGEEIRPVLEGMGFYVLELHIALGRNRKHIGLVIHNQQGVSLNDCSRVSRIIHPRLEMIEELNDSFTLEVSSPGMNRLIKNRREYEYFRGRGVKILLKDASEWTGGILEDTDENRLFLKQKERILEIHMDDIKKAKLSPEQEVE